MKPVSLENFVAAVNIKHNNKYDYSNVIYKNNYTKVEIKCPIHGVFWQTPKNHYRGGCKRCAYIAQSNLDFKNEATIIHNGKYNYDKVNYVNQLTPITIICPNHGEYLQSPKVHLRGHGSDILPRLKVVRFRGCDT